MKDVKKIKCISTFCAGNFLFLKDDVVYAKLQQPTAPETSKIDLYNSKDRKYMVSIDKGDLKDNFKEDIEKPNTIRYNRSEVMAHAFKIFVKSDEFKNLLTKLSQRK